jgi:hypothetical protein
MFGPAGEVRNAKHGECRVFTLFDVAAKSLDALRGFALYLGMVAMRMSPRMHVCSFSKSSEHTDSWIPLSCNNVEGYRYFLINPHLPNDCQLQGNQWPNPCQVVHPN